MIQPFPFARLPAYAREDIDLLASVRQAARTRARPEAIAAALAELTGEPVDLRVRHVERLEPSKLLTDGVGILFTSTENEGVTDAILVDAEPALATALVARVLRQRAPRVVETSREPRPEVAGALGAVLHAALRRAHAGTPLRVMAAGPASALMRDLVAGAHARLANVWITAKVGDDVFGARVCLTIDPRSPRQAVFSRASLTSFGDAPIALPLVATSCLAERALLAALAPGDVFVVPGFPLTAADHGVLAGPVAIVAPSSERGLTGQLGPDGRLVLGSGPLFSSPWTAHSSPTGGSMSDDPNATLAALEDAPVVVRVELGVVEMRAREWATLSAGDVVTLGRKLGDPAVLRVGGVEVARGELVQVDGEYGVRILPSSGPRP